MKNSIINLKTIKQVAEALGNLNNQVIYVGGATVSLYADDKAAEDIRPTKDIDISLKIASLAHLEEIRELLIQKGFKQTTDLKVICRFKLDGILVDVMATKPIGWAPANLWFEPGFDNLQKVDVNGTIIQIMPVSYFLASKFEAHNQRGGLDPRTSQDFEDIVYILDNNTNWHNSIPQENSKVVAYLKEQLATILKSTKLQEAILGNLSYETQEARYQMMIRKIKHFLNT